MAGRLREMIDRGEKRQRISPDAVSILFHHPWLQVFSHVATGVMLDKLNLADILARCYGLALDKGRENLLHAFLQQWTVIHEKK